jgi:membrane protein implicated in regulation of membrane protease activity
MGWPDDGVAAFFLICFFIGLLFTVISFFLGLGHDVAGVAVGADGLDHDGAIHLSHAQPAVGEGPPEQAMAHHGSPSPLNLSTIMAFLTWFGGAGYILRSYYGAWLWLAVVVGSAAGLAGATIVFAFLSRVLYASQRVLDPNDYRLPGTLARVSSPIRAGGTGEIIFTKDQTRQVAGARSVDGEAITRGTDVVIMRYERGLAYVQRWDDLMRGEGEQPGEPATPASH